VPQVQRSAIPASSSSRQDMLHVTPGALPERIVDGASSWIARRCAEPLSELNGAAKDLTLDAVWRDDGDRCSLSIARGRRVL
jgi:hypothetical protein